MDWDSVLSTSIATIASSIALHFMSKLASREVIEDKNGLVTIKSHRIFQITGIISTLICVVFAVVLFLEFNIALLLITIFIFLLFGGLGTLCILTYKNHFVRFDKEHFVARNLNGKYTKMKWKGIAYARYNGLSGYLVLKNREGRKAKISPYLVVFKSFVKEFRFFDNYCNLACVPHCCLWQLAVKVF